MAKLTYDNKIQMNENADIPAANKGRAVDWNEIKTVVNTNDDNVGDLSDLNTTDKTSVVSAINEVITKVPNYSDLTTLCNWTANTMGGGGVTVNMNDDMTKYSQLIILISEINNDTTGNAFYEIVNPLILKQLCNASGGKAYNIIYDIGDSTNNIRFTYNSDTVLRFWQAAGITQTLYMKVYGVI